MEINIVKVKQIDIAVVKNDEILIKDVQSALDFIATVQYNTGCNRVILDKTAFCEDFFQLKTKIAGDILQKFINYHLKLAIIGDFSTYSSKSLNDFIYECNHGNALFFLPDEQQALAKLSQV